LFALGLGRGLADLCLSPSPKGGGLFYYVDMAKMHYRLRVLKTEKVNFEIFEIWEFIRDGTV